VVAAAAGIVFLFDNKVTGDAGTVLLGSITVLFICGLAWLLFGLSDDTGYWPKKRINNHGIMTMISRFFL
jgi:hypothetical protein